MCIGEMHHINSKGGAAEESEENRKRLDYDNRRLQSGDEPSGATFPASGRPPRGFVEPEGRRPHDQPYGRGGANERKAEPNQGQRNGLAERGPAPAAIEPTHRPTATSTDLHRHAHVL